MLIRWALLGGQAPYRIGHLNSDFSIPARIRAKPWQVFHSHPSPLVPSSIPLLGSFLPSPGLSGNGKGVHLTLHPGFKEVFEVVPTYSMPVLNILFSHIVFLCLYGNPVG